MSYRAGIGPSMAALGFEPGEPHIYCDICGLKRSVVTRSGMPAQWFMNRKAAPGWRKEDVGDGLARDYCPQHKHLATEPKEGEG